jgi:hypothetical protein
MKQKKQKTLLEDLVGKLMANDPNLEATIKGDTITLVYKANNRIEKASTKIEYVELNRLMELLS